MTTEWISCACVCAFVAVQTTRDIRRDVRLGVGRGYHGSFPFPWKQQISHLQRILSTTSSRVTALTWSGVCPFFCCTPALQRCVLPFLQIEMQASEPKHGICILSPDLIEAVLCFVQRADLVNLMSVRSTCKEWKQVVDHRRDALDCRPFQQPGKRLPLSFCELIYNKVMAPRRYIELINIWTELEQLFSAYCQVPANPVPIGFDIVCSAPLTQFDDTIKDWLIQQALFIINGAPEMVYRLNGCRMKLDLRTRIYKELCGVMGVPPDPHMLHPTPPKGWTRSETYIVVDEAPCGGFYGINLDKTELRTFRVTLESTNDDVTLDLQESRCLNVWGDDRWSHWNDLYNLYTSPPIETRDYWTYVLLARVFAPPDCAITANIFMKGS